MQCRLQYNYGPNEPFPDVQSAIVEMRERMNRVQQGPGITTAIFDSDWLLQASMSSKRILALVVPSLEKTLILDRLADRVPTRAVDVTDLVLAMDPDGIRCLVDDDPRILRLVRQHQPMFDGEHVAIVQSIRSFFGVESRHQITSTALKFARMNGGAWQEMSATLTIQVRCQLAPGQELQDLLSTLQVGVVSRSALLNVTATQLIH